MPDISHQAVHQFWSDYPDPMLYRVIAFMESVEDWTADGDPDVEAALDKLANELENIGEIEIGAEKEFVELCAAIKTGRCLRLLMALDTAYPGAASKVIMHAEGTTETESDTAGIFLRRNIVFERLRLLGRVFSADRFNLIQAAIEESSYD